MKNRLNKWTPASSTPSAKDNEDGNDKKIIKRRGIAMERCKSLGGDFVFAVDSKSHTNTPLEKKSTIQQQQQEQQPSTNKANSEINSTTTATKTVAASTSTTTTTTKTANNSTSITSPTIKTESAATTESHTHNEEMSLSGSELELVELLQQGCRFCKVSKKNKPPTFRKFWVNEDYSQLCWESPSKLKPKETIKIGNIKSIQKGSDTVLFEKFKKTYSQVYEKYGEISCFSIIMNDDTTVDMICEDLMQIATWVKGLEMLREYYRKLKNPLQSDHVKKVINDSKLGVKRSNSAGSMSLSVSNVALEHKQSKRSSFKNFIQNTATGISGQIKKKSSTKTSILALFRNKNSNNGDDDPSDDDEPSDIEDEDDGKKKKSLQDLLNEDKSKQTSSLITTNEDKSLFDFVVVVKIKKEGDKNVPYISYSFPPANIQKKENKNMMLSIPMFCFPDAEMMEPSESIESKTYSFVLTDIDGTRRHGYCRRMLPSGTGKRLPDSYCIISSHSCFSLFSVLLDVVEERNSMNSVSVFQFLKTVLANPFPERGKTTIIKNFNPKMGKMEETKLSRPNSSGPMLEHIDFNPLFSKLKVEFILSLLVSLLMERRIIFVSNDISVLSACSHAAVALLYPFSWQHVFIPVLPKSLLEYVCSPVPFVVGILGIHRQYIEGLPMEEVVIVDLEKGIITGGDDYNILPSQALKTLKNSFTTVVQKNSKSNKKTTNQDIASSALNFFLALFGNYRAFTKPNKNDVSTRRQSHFDNAAFINSKPKKERKFFETFGNSQMFERWAFERDLKDDESLLGQFEKLSQNMK